MQCSTSSSSVVLLLLVSDSHIFYFKMYENVQIVCWGIHVFDSRMLRCVLQTQSPFSYSVHRFSFLMTHIISSLTKAKSLSAIIFCRLFRRKKCSHILRRRLKKNKKVHPRYSRFSLSMNFETFSIQGYANHFN